MNIPRVLDNSRFRRGYFDVPTPHYDNTDIHASLTARYSFRTTWGAASDWGLLSRPVVNMTTDTGEWRKHTLGLPGNQLLVTEEVSKHAQQAGEPTHRVAAKYSAYVIAISPSPSSVEDPLPRALEAE